MYEVEVYQYVVFTRFFLVNNCLKPADKCGWAGLILTSPCAVVNQRNFQRVYRTHCNTTNCVKTMVYGVQ